MAQNTAKPMDVVMLAKNKDTLLLEMAVCKALIFETPLINSAALVPYLFTRLDATGVSKYLVDT